MERTVDVIAAELGLDPAELRRRNLLPAGVFPYTSPTGAVYDSGDYAAALDRALELARYSDRRREQAARRAADDPRLLGIGVSSYVEVTAGAGPTEFADVEVHADASVTVRVGTFGHGQGHRTAFAQIAADALAGRARRRHRDRRRHRARRRWLRHLRLALAPGGRLGRRRGLRRGRGAGPPLAADLLEAAVDDVVHDDAGFAVAGVPTRRLSWAEVRASGRVARDRGRRRRGPGCSRPSTGRGRRRRIRSARTSPSSRSTARPGWRA